MPTLPTLPDILTPGDSGHSAEAVGHLRRYFGLDDGAPYTGARFESLGGGGDRAEVADVITAEDIVSLSMLAIRVHALAARRLLEDHELIEEIRGYLEEVPTDVDMVDANPALLAPGSSTDLLWTRLRKLHQFGETTTSKLMARKRPRLIPVYDSVIRRAFQMSGSGAQWTFWHEALTARNRSLHEHLMSLRAEAGLPDQISALRVLDIVVWMHHRHLDEDRDQVSESGV